MPSVLEQAGSVRYTGGSTVLQHGDSVIRTRVIEETTKLELTLTWPRANDGMVRAIREFYRANRAASFQFTVPDAGVGGGSLLYCEFVEPPRFARRGYQMATVTARIRRALLVDD